MGERIKVIKSKTIPEHVVRIAKADIAKYYSMKMSDAQVYAMLKLDTKLLKDFLLYNKTATSFDTFDREALPYLICKYLKIDKDWPRNGDSDESATAFFRELSLICAAEDIEFSGIISKSK